MTVVRARPGSVTYVPTLEEAVSWALLQRYPTRLVFHQTVAAIILPATAITGGLQMPSDLPVYGEAVEVGGIPVGNVPQLILVLRERPGYLLPLTMYGRLIALIGTPETVRRSLEASGWSEEYLQQMLVAPAE